MPLAGLPGWVAASTLLGFGIALTLLVLLAARSGSAVPIFTAAAVVGLPLVTLPLRDHGAVPIAAGLAWAGICASALVSFDGQGARLHATFALLLIVATVAVFVAWSVAVMAGDRPGIGRVAAGLLTLSFGALVLRSVVTSPPFGAFAPLPGGLSMALRLISVFAAAAAALLIVGVAAIAGVLLVVDEREEWSIPAPTRFRSLRRPRPPATTTMRDRDPLSQITHAVARFVAVAAYTVLTALSMAGTALLRIAHALLVFLIGVVNWLLQFVLACATYLKDAAVSLVRAAGDSLRRIVVPVAALAAAALLSVSFATTAQRYLAYGELVGIPEMLGCLLGAVVAIDVAWIAACAVGVSEAAKSAARSIVPLSAWFLIFMSIGGITLWVFGPLRPGPITVISTGVLVVLVAVGLLRRPAVRTI
ncbi:hypothetical protein ACGFJ7_12780 [Actinoplanes sp. NPDC048988]|uniref:hypothetical protein n=1 Tax=Actinoplanes sp. NPDC048988 TaxID=3363901 RepID=UPI00371E7173